MDARPINTPPVRGDQGADDKAADHALVVGAQRPQTGSLEATSFSLVSEPDSAELLPYVSESKLISDGDMAKIGQMIEVRNVIHLEKYISLYSTTKRSKEAIESSFFDNKTGNDRAVFTPFTALSH